MMGISLLMVMVAVAASAAEIYISDVVDVKINDGGNEFEILTSDNMKEVPMKLKKVSISLF